MVDTVVSYSKTEDDALMLLKAENSDIIYAFTISEDYTLLLMKADKIELTNYIDLASAQPITV